MSKKICLLYGLGEGKWHGDYFCRLLRQAGFQVVTDVSRADIIITHSGGCFIIPASTRADIIMIDPCFWPGRSFAKSFVLKVWRDYLDYWHRHKQKAWLVKTFWNIVYMFTRPLHTILMLVKSGDQRLQNIVTSQNSLIIRNRDDVWLTPDFKNIWSAAGDIRAVTLAGQHDDCWHNPEPYIALLKEALK